MVSRLQCCGALPLTPSLQDSIILLLTMLLCISPPSCQLPRGGG
ncbi:hypothetical protein I7I48_02816 [Histoplasma ohiense]|nr:hypothetical protein I7I48_02816 [Histoplasma ohiense (nom. inval.)]